MVKREMLKHGKSGHLTRGSLWTASIWESGRIHFKEDHAKPGPTTSGSRGNGGQATQCGFAQGAHL